MNKHKTNKQPLEDSKEEKKMTYKVSVNYPEKDYYTDDEQDAKNKFQTYVQEYEDGVRLYEAEVPEADDDSFDWDIIDSYDKDDYEDVPDSKEGLQDKHTPLPWAIGYGLNSNSYGIFTKRMLDHGHQDHPICLISPLGKMTESDQANAELIVKAVNERKALLDALELALHRMSERSLRNELEDEDVPVYNAINAALNNAKNIK